ncbi:MAG: hypothetical protein PWR11_1136, partial [Bacillota bacterium]|nr:hypothetical protein [Bacillota bacterium]
LPAGLRLSVRTPGCIQPGPEVRFAPPTGSLNSMPKAYSSRSSRSRCDLLTMIPPRLGSCQGLLRKLNISPCLAGRARRGKPFRTSNTRHFQRLSSLKLCPGRLKKKPNPGLEATRGLVLENGRPYRTVRMARGLAAPRNRLLGQLRAKSAGLPRRRSARLQELVPVLGCRRYCKPPDAGKPTLGRACCLAVHRQL